MKGEEGGGGGLGRRRKERKKFQLTNKTAKGVGVRGEVGLYATLGVIQFT